MSTAGRIHPHVTVRDISRFQSSRNGVKPRLIVVHATESPERHDSSSDLAAIGSWFNNPEAEVSSHVCTDGDGNSARYVADEEKAWHCAAFNSVSLGIEQIGYTAYKRGDWSRDHDRETARWIARWSLKYAIPIRHGAVSGSSVVRAGVVRHSDLGAAGGGHGDPGANFDLQGLLNLAKFYRGKLRG